MAIGCIVGLRQLGYQIPGDMSVMGIDDITSAQFVVPSLTTIALSLYDLGKVGMESLIGLRNGERAVDDVITLPHHLVVRQSTASPRQTPASSRALEEGKTL
jgi:DNA-binding LacI/PurR family transcriptional regulator